MKNTSADNENNAVVDSFNDFGDALIQSKRGQSLSKCSNNLLDRCDSLKTLESNSSLMGHKGRFYQRVLSKSSVSYESRSQSLPNSLDNKNKSNGNVSDTCDTQTKLLPENESPPQSPTQELWFNTWPERSEKTKCIDVEETNTNGFICKSPSPSKVCDNLTINGSEQQTNTSVNNILTLNEALQSISLAYSPLTKQLHYIQSIKEDVPSEIPVCTESETKPTKLGHRRIEAGSFSSTVSSLSDPSPSGSLLDAEERIPSPNHENGAKPKKKGLASFFSRNVFSWRSPPPPSDDNASGSPKHEDIVASSSALIQHIRPSHLPAKDLDEEQRHRDEYKAMLLAAKKREVKNSVAKQKLHRLQLQVEDQLATTARFWNTQILPKWDVMQKNKKTRDLWWQGLPSSVRGKVWRLAIGNDLNLTKQLYEICLSRAQTRLNNTELNTCGTGTGCVAANQQHHGGDSTCSDVDQEGSLDVIKLDIARTFPNLCIFQEGGPYSCILHSLLAAYVCYRPDVGYVQGMSFIAAILILNMELFDAFICFANLLNRPLHLAAYTLNQRQMQAYYAAYNEIFNYNLPKLFAHFEKSGLTPDLYLLDWVYTVFSKAMPLDVACRVWDVFLRDGDEFIFRTALGVLHLHQELLLNMDFLHGAQFLTRLPDDLCADNLFRSIQAVCVSVGKQTFSQIVDRCKENL